MGVALINIQTPETESINIVIDAHELNVGSYIVKIISADGTGNCRLIVRQ